MSKKSKNKNKKQSEASNQNVLGRVLKSSLIAAGLSILLIVLYAFLIYLGWLDSSSVPIVNTVIKAIGAALASILTVKHVAKRRWLFGALSGAVYIVLAFAVFSILSETFVLSTGILSDMALGIVAGTLASFLYASVKK